MVPTVPPPLSGDTNRIFLDSPLIIIPFLGDQHWPFEHQSLQVPRIDLSTHSLFNLISRPLSNRDRAVPKSVMSANALVPPLVILKRRLAADTQNTTLCTGVVRVNGQVYPFKITHHLTASYPRPLSRFVRRRCLRGEHTMLRAAAPDATAAAATASAATR